MNDVVKPETINSFHELLDKAQSLMLATADNEGIPESSTTPFIRDEAGSYYIYVSMLARHTRNLMDNQQASIMLVEDESDCRQFFARKRIQYQCRAVMANEADRMDILAAFARRYGKVMELLSGLPDFQLVRLTPLEGQFVMGFGQAYALGGARLDQLSLIGPN